MSKTANLYARIEPDLKEQAENILNALGIPASNAITMFYRQIILNNGLPFELKLPQPPNNVDTMTAEQFDSELEKGYIEAYSGNTIPMDKAFSDIHEELNK